MGRAVEGDTALKDGEFEEIVEDGESDGKVGLGDEEIRSDGEGEVVDEGLEVEIGEEELPIDGLGFEIDEDGIIILGEGDIDGLESEGDEGIGVGEAPGHGKVLQASDSKRGGQGEPLPNWGDWTSKQ